jgi:hypothetical protein
VRVASAARSLSAAARRLEVWVVVVALVPIAAAIARHSGRRWTAIGDNALVELRSRDVFSARHFPFLGTWSSASLTAGKDLNHPGPLLFDLLAVPVRLFGGTTGVVLGIGLINAAATIGAAIVGYRLAGRNGSILATLTAAALAHSLGSGMLTDPWNPHPLIVPSLLMFMLTWAVAAGSFSMMPWLLAVGSLCVQTHLGYVYLVPACCLIGVAGTVIVHRRRWRSEPACRPVDLAAMRRSGAFSLATVLVLWAQPLIEQLTGEGQGNLARIVTSTQSDGPVVGPRLGARIIAAIVAIPPWWNRSSIVDAVPLTPYNTDNVTVTPAGVPRAVIALVALVALGVVVIVAAVTASRRRDRVGLAAVITAACLLIVAIGTLVVMPIGPLGLTPHQMRWLWSIAAFTWFAVGLVVMRTVAAALPGRFDRSRRWSVDQGIAAGLAGVVVVIAAFNLPAYNQLVGPDTFQDAIPVARSLSDQVDDYRTDEVVWFDTSGLRYLEPFSAVVMAALERAGVDFRMTQPGLVRQVGNNRRVTGDEPIRMIIREGREALDAPEGMERIAFTSALTPTEVIELLAGEQAMIDEIALGGIVLTPAGRQAIDAGAYGLTRGQILDAALDPVGFVYGGLAAELVAGDALDVDSGSVEVFDRTSTLRRRVDVTTVAVFAGPNV